MSFSLTPKDAVQGIALNLEYPDIIKLCQSSKKMQHYVCDDKYFWMNKITKDFGYMSLSLDEIEREWPLLFRKYQGN